MGISFSSFPKPMNEVYGMGFNFGAQGELEFTKNIGLRLGLDYGSFSSDKTKFPYTDGNGKAIPSSDITGLNVGIFGLTVSGVGKLPLKGGFTPYGLIGFGLNFIGASDLVVRVNGQDYTPDQRRFQYQIRFELRCRWRVPCCEEHRDIRRIQGSR